MSVAIHVDQKRDESCLGASEAAGVLGCDRYNPPIAVWRKHRGLPVHDGGDSEPAYWGTVLEPVVRGHYAVTSKRLVVVPTRSTTREGWLRCTPDGITIPVPPVMAAGCLAADSTEHDAGALVERAHVFGVAGGLQVKTCSAYLLDDWKEGPPAKYEIQCRVEMAVTGLPWTDIVCLCGGQKYLGPFRLERDLAIEERILEPLRDFWDMVQTGREPTVDHTDAWRLHVSEKMERARPVMVNADDAFEQDISDWRERRRVRIVSKRAEDQAKNQLLLRLSAAGATKVDAGEFKITAYKAKGTWALKTPSAWKEDA